MIFNHFIITFIVMSLVILIIQRQGGNSLCWIIKVHQTDSPHWACSIIKAIIFIHHWSRFIRIIIKPSALSVSAQLSHCLKRLWCFYSEGAEEILRALGYWEISKVKPQKKRVSLGKLSKTLLLVQKEFDRADILIIIIIIIKILMTNDRMNVGVQPTNPAQLSLFFQLSRKDLQPPRPRAFALFIFVTSVCIWKHLEHVGSSAIRGNMVIHTVPQSWGSDITLKTLNSQNIQTSCRFMCASARKFDLKYFSRFHVYVLSTIIIFVNITLRDRQRLNILSLFLLF